MFAYLVQPELINPIYDCLDSGCIGIAQLEEGSDI